MTLKRKINKETFDKLSDAEKQHYKPEGMDYLLDAEGFDDPAPELRRAKDREKARADALEAEKSTLTAKVSELEGQLATDPSKRNDIKTLEDSWKGKLTEAEKKGKGAVEALQASVKKLLIDGTAGALAGKISTSPSLLLPHIKGRLTVDFAEGEEPTLRILGADGKVSALSVEDLEKEFVANADFSAIIVGSKGSGGGANGGKQGGGGANKKLADMDSKERAEYQKRDPQGFKKEAEAAKAAGPRI